jgi:hypothetical protein
MRGLKSVTYNSHPSVLPEGERSEDAETFRDSLIKIIFANSLNMLSSTHKFIIKYVIYAHKILNNRDKRTRL